MHHMSDPALDPPSGVLLISRSLVDALDPAHAVTSESPVLYEIDHADRIVRVNAAWSDVADAVAVPGLRAPHVIGRSLWDFVGDATTRQLYAAMLARARRGAPPLTFSFRCDTPTQRRLMDMRITGLGAGGVSFEVRELEVQERPPVALLGTTTPRHGLIRMCSWCKRIPLATGEWVEVEEAMQVLDILDAVPLPAISHGMCPACFRSVSDALERDEGGGMGAVTLGSLPPA
jgi:hypothetical protein